MSSFLGFSISVQARKLWDGVCEKQNYWIKAKPHPEKYANSLAKLQAWVAKQRENPENVVHGEFKAPTAEPVEAKPAKNPKVAKAKK